MSSVTSAVILLFPPPPGEGEGLGERNANNRLFISELQSITLSVWGEREDRRARLQSSVNAFEAALENFERAKMKYQVGVVRGNLEDVQALIVKRTATP